jgi:hypothetical protein
MSRPAFPPATASAALPWGVGGGVRQAQPQARQSVLFTRLLSFTLPRSKTRSGAILVRSFDPLGVAFLAAMKPYTCANPEVYKTTGSPRLTERNKNDITFIDY